MQRIAVKFMAAVCGDYPAPYALKETDTVIVLQLFYSGTYRGLCHMQSICSLGYAAVLINRHKNPYMP